MENILKAENKIRNIDFYFNEKKKVYDPIPIFPNLSQMDILYAIQFWVDEKIFDIELKELISKNQDKKVIDTDYIICLVRWNEYPEVVKLLGIVREWAFRNEGGGVGDIDFDEYDLRPEMEQLLIINPNYGHPVQAIIGGYRYIIQNKNTYSSGPMGAHFDFSEKWKSEKWIELGRSFMNPYYAMRKKRPSMDYVLYGLGYILATNPGSAGFFGKVTLYNIYERTGADKYFLAVAEKFWKITGHVQVKDGEAIPAGTLTEEQNELCKKDIFKAMFISLRRDYKLNIVPIMAIYNRLTNLKNMEYFGAFLHKEFGRTIEVGIAIAYEDIFPHSFEKYVDPYRK